MCPNITRFPANSGAHPTCPAPARSNAKRAPSAIRLRDASLCDRHLTSMFHARNAAKAAARISICAQCGFSLHGLDRRKEFVELEWLPQNQSPNAPNECVDLRVTPVPGHEDKPLAQVRPDPFHCPVEHIAGKPGHDHIAQYDIKIDRQDLLHAFGAAPHVRYAKITRLQK